ncbi:hypothetical protein Q1695_008136 [Nippostrongylus brasiliensis]|nr:hypothetical protein Q1695_008136 [Nippostrongylus brasiliensis]
MMLAAVNPYSSSSSNNHFQIQDVTDDPEYSSYGNENEAPEEGALVEYCRLDKKNQQSVPRICEASTVVSAKLRNPPLILISNPEFPLFSTDIRGTKEVCDAADLFFVLFLCVRNLYNKQPLSQR